MILGGTFQLRLFSDSVCKKKLGNHDAWLCLQGYFFHSNALLLLDPFGRQGSDTHDAEPLQGKKLVSNNLSSAQVLFGGVAWARALLYQMGWVKSTFMTVRSDTSKRTPDFPAHVP